MLATALNNDHGLSIYLRWSAIRVGNAPIPITPGVEPVRALHVVTTENESHRAKKKLEQIYHMHRTTFPLGIRLRFVPNKVSPKGIVKIKRCRYEQSVWLANIEHERYNGIELLDTKSRNLTSLREQLMKIPSSSGEHSLFFCVNQHWNNPSSVVFTFRKEDREEARYMIPAVYTFVTKSTQNRDYDKYFNNLARLHAKEFSWDAATKSITHKDDDRIPEAATAADIIFFGLEKLMIYDEDATTNSEIGKIDNTASSVQTFTSGTTINKPTGKFDDASTIASVNSIDTYINDANQVSIVNVHEIKRDIAKLTNSVTLLNVATKARENETKQILDKIEQVMNKNTTTQITDSNTTDPSTQPTTTPRTDTPSPRNCL
jgi:hypothetical protein